MKIVVAGPLQCGKSSYIKFLDPNAMNVNAKGSDDKFYTVAMDLGSLQINGFFISLFGTPGLRRFQVMRDIVSEGSDGLIYMFDAPSPEKDDDAIAILNTIRNLLEPNTPIIFLANKQDVAGARSPEVVMMQNNLPKEYKVFPTSTITGLNIKESLKYIINEIYENYASLLQILRKYETNIKALAEKLNKSKIEMRDFLNNLEIKRFIEIDRHSKTYKVREGLRNIT